MLGLVFSAKPSVGLQEEHSWPRLIESVNETLVRDEVVLGERTVTTECHDVAQQQGWGIVGPHLWPTA